jgi:hypothetical protein
MHFCTPKNDPLRSPSRNRNRGSQKCKNRNRNRKNQESKNRNRNRVPEKSGTVPSLGVEGGGGVLVDSPLTFVHDNLATTTRSRYSDNDINCCRNIFHLFFLLWKGELLETKSWGCWKPSLDFFCSFYSSVCSLFQIICWQNIKKTNNKIKPKSRFEFKVG